MIQWNHCVPLYSFVMLDKLFNLSVPWLTHLKKIKMKTILYTSVKLLLKFMDVMNVKCFVNYVSNRYYHDDG